jgi:hypothetical protein
MPKEPFMTTSPHSPQAVQEPRENIQADIETTLADIRQMANTSHSVANAEELAALEREIAQLTNRLCGLIVGQKLQEALDSAAVQAEALSLMKAQPKRYKYQGWRAVPIRTLHGQIVRVKTTYFSRAGVKRKKNRRGCYPGLIVMGIHDRCTPECASEISQLAVILSSFAEAEQVLRERGVNIGEDSIRTISQHYAHRAKAAQAKGVSGLRCRLTGCRVVISTDGGRMRIRKKKPGPKTAKGGTRYTTKWREPKLLMIYVVNHRGDLIRTVTPIIDGTLRGPDALFGLLRYYLAKLHVHLATQVVFVADGARWIWKRVQPLLTGLGLKPAQYTELVDFYHAAQHLNKVATLRSGWTASQRKRWFNKHRKLLLHGKIDAVLKAIEKVCQGKTSKKLHRERAYFERNRQRMTYHIMSQKGLPIGSGAMESAIRRVINLRLKGASMYWSRDAAEAMILLRSYYKAGRWESLKTLAFSTSTYEVA